MDRILKTLNRATEAEYLEGMNWYISAKEFASKLHPDIRKAAGVIAALSPRQRWEANMEGARKIFRSLNNGSSIMPKVGGVYLNAEKAWRIAHGEDPDEVLKSSDPARYFKVRRFFSNILGNHHLVTIDTWTAMAAMSNPPDSIRGKLYLDLEKRFQRLAEKVKLPPRELQAICWVVMRNNGTEKAAKRNTIPDGRTSDSGKA
jgi:hypothetical protein